MWRYLVGGAAAMALVGAGWLIFDGAAHPDALPITAASARPAAGSVPADPPAAALPEAPARSREQKRFDRYDRDRNGRITQEEYFSPRRKAFARLDTNGDGRLTFEEWAIKTTTRFTEADRDHSGTMDAAEFATTAPKRKAPRPACRCEEPVKQDD